MNCESARTNLSALIDGELEEPFASGLREHLQRCGLCRSDYERLLKAAAVLEVWDDTEPPAGLKRRIVRQAGTKRFFPRLTVVLPAAAIVFLLLSVALIYRERAIDPIAVPAKPASTMAKSAIAADGKEASVGTDIDEDEIIGNLQMLEEKDFYDSLDSMKELDYLPLVDSPDERKPTERTSGLEFLTV